ncbi:uncharacterized protein LOC109846125 [Asparagus officinalis]|uniref:uncharacterized protein LOC109846125 n=1 Tax=Asparagus officinalis TaxID=4686 RepID=UPI00098E442D|nr:uncharacterized protein LOC109846125 [Asparagus officinalis]
MDLGLDYKKIHACPNDCMLYRGEDEEKVACSKCGESRWKANKQDVPAKVLRYFPLKPRVQRLFMCSQTAESMSWHAKERLQDGNLRHPADGKAWKDFDSNHPDFALDPRNVRLGLASDGFNPFRTMSISHSTWPVILINYNLPPWMSLKPEYFMLSLLIPGPQSPGNNIDVYLQPLIDDLKELWEVGLLTYDASSKQPFYVRAALLWTISDFPAFAMLSGWSTKGKLACPCCNYGTCSQYLKYSRKMCYMGHRRFLSDNHPWRLNRRNFNGHVELGKKPESLSGIEIMEELRGFVNDFGKKQKKKLEKGCPWKKRLIFFDLPYWEQNTCRHLLDLMHIEKNVCDNIIGTLLDIPEKTKDHVRARFDLQHMGIRRDLHPTKSADGRHFTFAKACFSMTMEEKKIFCGVLKNAKMPHGCASNISRCVNVNEKKISGYKTHDAHFLMQYLLSVALRRTMPRRVSIPLIRLGAFFKGLCSKVLNLNDLYKLQSEIVEILCQLEKIFLPSFFDIMVHLPIHLVQQILDCGPVNYCWMYPVERYLCRLKSYVRNRSAPEGSIAEGYLAEESLTFCSLYLHDGVKTRFNRYTRKYDEVIDDDEPSPIFPKIGHPVGGKRKRKGKAFALDDVDWVNAHRYALFNCGNREVGEYIREHKLLIENQPRKRGRRRKWVEAQRHSKDFLVWFKDTVAESQSIPKYMKFFSMGPNNIAKRYRGYYINGYTFYIKARDDTCKTQNSGVSLLSEVDSYTSSRDHNPITAKVSFYGVIQDIIELDYWGNFSVVLFKCDWFQHDTDEYGLTRVNFNNKCHTNDPFVMACQVHQVFYVKDPVEERSILGRNHDNEMDSMASINDDDADNIGWCRDGLPRSIVDIPPNMEELEDENEGESEGGDQDESEGGDQDESD